MLLEPGLRENGQEWDRHARKFYTEKQNNDVQGEKHRSVWGKVSVCVVRV